MPKLERFISQLLAIIEPILFPRRPRQSRFRHRDVFSHLQFRSQNQRLISKIFRKIDISMAAVRDRQIGEASRFDNEITTALSHFKSGLKKCNCLAKISTKEINQSESEANMRRF